MSLNLLRAYEDGDLSDDATVRLFQRLIDNGTVWQLQGHYGRTARYLIECGVCRPAPRPRKK